MWQLIAFLFTDPVDDPAAWERVMVNGAGGLLGSAREALAGLGEFTTESVEGALSAIVETEGVKAKALYQPLRVALTGSTVSPGIFESVAALGSDQTLARIDAALVRLKDAESGHSV